MPFKDPDDRKVYEEQRSKDAVRRAKKVEYERQRREKWKADGTYAARRREEGYKSKLRERGIDMEKYQQMVDERCGRCDICGDAMMPACVDHDHITGQVRGLLCDNCNVGIGRLKDRHDIVSRAADYLAAPPGLASLHQEDLLAVGGRI